MPMASLDCKHPCVHQAVYPLLNFRFCLFFSFFLFFFPLFSVIEMHSRRLLLPFKVFCDPACQTGETGRWQISFLHLTNYNALIYMITRYRKFLQGWIITWIEN